MSSRRTCLLLSYLALAPLAAARPDPPKGQEKPAAPAPPTDLYGDPLPAGAVAGMGTVRLRQGGDILFIAFSPDGKTLASAGRGGLRLWDVATGKEIRRFEGHRAEVYCVAFSPDGKTLASGD